jgi:ubiquinone/menaquinone biosynthesis C-methylase UbiE
VFQSISDDSRLRLLRLLCREELNVQELVRITGLSQPRVSRHLAVLREQGWVQQRKEGTWSWYCGVDPDAFPAGGELFVQVRAIAEQMEHAQADERALQKVLLDRQARSRDFFAEIADHWDEFRQQYEHPDIGMATIGAMLAADLKVLDIGTGTGALLPVFGRRIGTVIALDSSQAMLDRARARCFREGVDSVRFCSGDVNDLPFGDGSFDVCHCAMVLHHVDRPAAAVQQMARVLRPGGHLVITAFCPHEQTWMREELAHRHLGFSRQEVATMYADAGVGFEDWLVRGKISSGSVSEPVPAAAGRAIEWPEVFLVTGVKLG